MKASQGALLEADLTPTEAATQRNDVLWIVVNDPKNKPSVVAVARALAENFAPGDTVSANLVRPYLPSWINPACIGGVFGGLVSRGALAFIGEEVSTKKNTHAKKVGTYRVVGDPS